MGVASSTLLIGEHVSWKPPTGRGKWDRMIAHCIDPDPARRFQSAAEVARALGPSQLVKWSLVAAATVALAAGSGVITYERATAPPERVRLALVPFVPAPENASVTGPLLRNAANELKRLKSTAHTSFRFIALDKVIRNRVHTPEEARVLVEASHALRATVEQHGANGFTVHAYLTDLRSGVDAREWSAEYKADELRYAPTALAGLVTETLHLPAPTGGASVNAAARKDYLAGLAAMRRDGTVDAALKSFQKAEAEDRDSALTWAGLAEAQRLKSGMTGDKEWLDRATASVQEAEKRDPDLPEVHRIAGLVKASSGWYEQAIQEYQRAIELDPKNDDAYRRLGEAYEDNNQLEQALSAFRKAIKTRPAAV